MLSTWRHTSEGKQHTLTMLGKVNEVHVHHGQREQRVVRTQLVQTQPGKQASIDEATVRFCA